jgi:DNA helicase-4
VKNPSIFAVGDDWQSIYRFTGSDLDMFINFENYFGKTYKTKIENTYRNAQELLDVVGDFITANPHQIKKYLKSNKIILDSKKEYENLEKSKNLEKNDSNSHIHSSKLIEDEKNYEEYFKYPVLVFKYYKNKIETLIHSLNFLNRKGSKDIVLLGRFNFDIRFIRESSFFKVVDQKKYIEITYKALPNLSIKFYTIHKAKGLEADDIVLINNTSSIYGFPSQRSDDNLLRYVLTDKDNYDYAEERRLFYVALTRTKNHCILLTDFVNPSSFSDEISLMKNVFVEDLHEVDIISCPKCKTGNIIEREGPRGVFLSCTNYPQCDFSSDFESKKLIEKNVKCPRCGSQLVVRTRNRANSYGSAGSKFLGCSSYPGCTHIENIKDEYLN